MPRRHPRLRRTTSLSRAPFARALRLEPLELRYLLASSAGVEHVAEEVSPFLSDASVYNLRILSVETVPSTPAPGQQFGIRVTYEATDLPPTPYAISFSANDWPAYVDSDVDYGTNMPGTTLWVRETAPRWLMHQGGSYQVSAYLDSQNVITDESSEADNALSVPFQVSPGITPEWQLVAADQGLALLGPGTNVIVGTMDDAFDYLHPWFTGNDSLGRPRLVAALQNSSGPGGSPANAGHATGVMGIVLARGNDSGDLTGLAPDARYVTAEFLDRAGQGPLLRDPRDAAGFLVANGAETINMSWSWALGTADPEAGEDQINLLVDYLAYGRGIVVVPCVNQPQEGQPVVFPPSPGSSRNVITVGGLDGTLTRAWVGQYVGPTRDGRNKPDLLGNAALDVVSPTWEWRDGILASAGAGGTSFSAPFVTGAAAQMLGYAKRTHGITDHRAIKAVLMNSAVKTLDADGSSWSAISGRPLDDQQGTGVLNLVRAYEMFSRPDGPGTITPRGFAINDVLDVAQEPYTNQNGRTIYRLGSPTSSGNTLDVTLAWDRHTFWNDGNANGAIDRFDQFFTSPSDVQDNLDIVVYRNGQIYAMSSSALDTVEHLHLTNLPIGSYEVHVVRRQVTNSGIGESFSLAWHASGNWWSETDSIDPGSVSGVRLTPDTGQSGFDARTNSLRPSFSWNAASDVGGSGLAGYWVAINDNSPESGGAFTASPSFGLASDLAAASYTLYVRAVDNAGNLGSTTSLPFTIDNIRPSVTSTGPANGSTLTSGPNEILVNFTEPMYDLDAADLVLGGPGRGTITVTGASFVDADTASFTLSGAWAAGQVTLTLNGGYPRDLAGNELNTYGGSFTVSPADTTGPSTAVQALPDVTVPGALFQVVTVDYTDSQSGVDTSTLDSTDVWISAPNGVTGYADFVSARPIANGWRATYRFVAPGGAWDITDNSTYTATAITGRVRDLAGNNGPSMNVPFTVNVPPGLVSLSVANSSFELPTRTDGTWQPDGFPTSWTSAAGTVGVQNWLDAQYPGATEGGVPSTIPEGVNAAYVHGDGGNIRQLLTGNTLQPNSRYYLAADVGHRLDDANFPGYRLELWAGGTPLTPTSTNLPTPGFGEFRTASQVYEIGDIGGGIGETLEIRLYATGAAANLGQVNFDQVRLYRQASAVPGLPDLLPEYDSAYDEFHPYFDPNHPFFVGSRSDNITAIPLPQFLVPGTIPGAEVSLYIDGTLVQTQLASSETTWFAPIIPYLTDGIYLITARQHEPGKLESTLSPTLQVQIDTTPPEPARNLQLNPSVYDAGWLRTNTLQPVVSWAAGSDSGSGLAGHVVLSVPPISNEFVPVGANSNQVILDTSIGAGFVQAVAVDRAANFVIGTAPIVEFLIDIVAPTVSNTTPSNGALLTTGPSEILVDFSEPLQDLPGVIPSDLVLSGAGRGTIVVTGASFADFDTVRFTLTGTWGMGVVNVALLTGYPRDRANNPLTSYSGAFTIQNAPPTAHPGGPYTISEGGSLGLDASASTPAPGRTLTTYAWDLNGDGLFTDAAGVNPTVTWAQLVELGLDDGPASHPVRVRVTDNQEDSATSDAVTLTINPTPPQAGITGPATGSVGQTLTYQFTASDPSPGDLLAPVRFRIDWNGDGAADQFADRSGDTSFVSHSFSVPGTYTIGVRARDRDLTYGPQVAWTITITGTAFPDIDVRSGVTSIPAGDTTPTVSDGTDFAYATLLDETSYVTHTFTIANTGGAPLDLSGGIDITGATGDYTITQPPAASVAPGNSTTFNIRFSPLATGLRFGGVVIHSNDPDEAPYTFSLWGRGLFPTNLSLAATVGSGPALGAGAENDRVSLFDAAHGFAAALAKPVPHGVDSALAKPVPHDNDRAAASDAALQDDLAWLVLRAADELWPPPKRRSS